MLLSGEAYSRRLEEFADSTLLLIMELDTMGKEQAVQASKIAANSELTEEQVVAALRKLLEGT